MNFALQKYTGDVEVSSDFLSDECGKAAVRLAARGSTIIAELLKLSERIPNPFRSPQDSEYKEVLCDFTYFRNQEEFDQKISASSALSEKDDTFRQTHIELLGQFFQLFKAVLLYVNDLNTFVQEINDGVYVSQSVESVLNVVEGRQLLGEIHHLYAVMLLLLDYKIGGKTREYLLVSYIRYQGAAGDVHSIGVTQLCRSTGYDPDGPLPKGYPVAYFRRVPVQEDVVAELISRIRSDDLYRLGPNYPSPDHRCVAVSLQGALLYTLLFFCPILLESNKPIMREMVDKHFSDNWVINYYLGFTADLTFVWNDFDAARVAIENTVQMENVQYHGDKQAKVLQQARSEISSLLRDGVLTEDYVLDHIYSSILDVVRAANVSLRWFILHGTRGGPNSRHFARLKPVYDYVKGLVSREELMDTLLQTAQLEFKLRAMFNQFLPLKREKWRNAKEKSMSMSEKLSDYFLGDAESGGGSGGSGGTLNEQLSEWFLDISERISTLKLKNGASARRKLQRLIKALEGVEEYRQVNDNLHVLQLVNEIQSHLLQMIRFINIEYRVLSVLSNVADLSYAWEKMSTFNLFVYEIQQKIKQNPLLALQIRAVFVKLSSVLELPCNRLDQACQQDDRYRVALESTSSFYSDELASFMRKVLHVIPTSIFETLRVLMQLLTNVLEPCPTKVARSCMGEVSQLTVRGQVSQLTADIARYASGILAMEHTLLGVLHIDSHQLLVDGIRRELVDQVARELHSGLFYDSRNTPTTMKGLEKDLKILGQRLQGIKHSFEYIQDFIYVKGHRIWLEEFSRILSFNVEMECNSFLKKKLYPWRSPYQSTSIPIPYFDRKEGEQSAYGFLGNFVEFLLTLSDPSRATYLPSVECWVSRDEAREEVLGPRTFKILLASIGAQGLSALDRLLCFLTAKDLQLIVVEIESCTTVQKDALSKIENSLTPSSGTPSNATEIYFQLLGLFKEDFPYFFEIITRIGRLQLFRRLISYELSGDCQLQASALFSASNTANDAFLEQVSQAVHHRGPPLPTLNGGWIDAALPFLDRAGVTDIFSKVYLDPLLRPPLPHLSLVLFASLVRSVSSVTYSPKLGCYLPLRPSDQADVVCYTAGISLLLRQYHEQHFSHLLSLIGQSLRVSLLTYEDVGKKRHEAEVLPLFGEIMTHFAKLLLEWRTSDPSNPNVTKVLQRLVPPTLQGGMRHLGP